MADETPLPILQGTPFSVRATITDGATTWPDGHQVYGQARTRPGGEVLLDLAPYCTSQLVGADLVVDVELTGRVTRTLERAGVYDLYVSEPGVEEARAVRVLHGPVLVERAVTAAPA